MTSLTGPTQITFTSYSIFTIIIYVQREKQFGMMYLSTYFFHHYFGDDIQCNYFSGQFGSDYVSPYFNLFKLFNILNKGLFWSQPSGKS